MVAIDEAWYGENGKMSWHLIANQNGRPTECYFYTSADMRDTVFQSAMLPAITFLGSVLFGFDQSGLFWAATFPLFFLPFLFHGPDLLKNYKYRRKLREMGTNKMAVPLTEKSLDDLLFDNSIQGRIVGFVASANYPMTDNGYFVHITTQSVTDYNGRFISRGDGLPLMAGYVIFEDSFDQVLFMVKHGIVKS